jgi:DNA-binding winged helix-turn-helix (wHTH) protein
LTLRSATSFATEIPLTPKAFDMLLVLVENGGRLLEKEELMRRLWPDSFVEEGNLAQNVSMLRRALGEARKVRGSSRPCRVADTASSHE